MKEREANIPPAAKPRLAEAVRRLVDLYPGAPGGQAGGGGEFIRWPRAVQVQFRYAFVCDADGVEVLDVTDLAAPKPVTSHPLPGARNIYLARTYAYVVCGSLGLAILDIERPERPTLEIWWSAKS